MRTETVSRSALEVAAMLRRRLPVIVVCALLGGLAAGAYVLHAAKQYTATAAVLFNINEPGQQAAGLQAVVSPDPALIQQTNVALLSVGDMAQRTARVLGSSLTKQRVADAISISPVANTTLVDVAATSRSPRLAAAIANAYSSFFVNEQETANQQYYRKALRTVDRELARLPPAAKSGSQGVALEQRAQALSTLSEIRAGNVSIAQTAGVPSGPSSPRPLTDIAIGLFVGLLVGLVIASARERFDQRLRTPDDLVAAYELPLLGSVPDSPALQDFSRTRELPARESEAFQLLHAHLRYFNVDRELRTLLIASATPGDGKTTVATQLAIAAARLGANVLLVEIDLRKPTLLERLGGQAGPGIADVLVGRASLESAAQQLSIDVTHAGASESRQICVLFAGSVLPPNPAELLESSAMGQLLADARDGFDLVIMDTPPLSLVADAFPLLQKVDGVVLVGRVGQHRRDAATRLARVLRPTWSSVLGIVANGVKGPDVTRYGYYGYQADAESTPAVAE